MSLTVSVIVPTWRRPADLHRCLDTLADQARAHLDSFGERADPLRSLASYTIARRS